MAKTPVVEQVSAGGAAFRKGPDGYEVALVSVLPSGRWQLPKGAVDPGETSEMAALREVREEAGIEAEILGPLETIEYWYAGTDDGRRYRFHKRVHFFLMSYVSGDVSRHDDEVAEARWVEVEAAKRMLAFKSERGVVERAAAQLASRGS